MLQGRTEFCKLDSCISAYGESVHIAESKLGADAKHGGKRGASSEVAASDQGSTSGNVVIALRSWRGIEGLIMERGRAPHQGMRDARRRKPAGVDFLLAILALTSQGPRR